VTQVAFLNITGFRDFPLGDMPMLAVLQVRYKSIAERMYPRSLPT
jgi:hypothetical protein